MDVDVEDSLPSSRTRERLEDDSLRAQLCFGCATDPSRKSHTGAEIFVRGREGVNGVCTRHHERMTWRGREDIHEGDRTLSFGNA